MKPKGTTRTVDMSHGYRSMSGSEYNTMSQQQRISESESDAIYDWEFGYVNSIGYDYIEAYLNGDELIGTMKEKFEENKDKYLKAIKSLDSVTQKNSLKRDVSLYRFNDTRSLRYNWGINVSGKSDSEIVQELNSKKGSAYTEKSFLSTSSDERKNKMGYRPVRITIQAPKGTKAFVTRNTDESEVILGRGMKYKLVEAKLDKGKINVVYRIV